MRAHDEYLPDNVIPIPNFQLAARIAQMYYDSGDPETAALKYESVLQREDINDDIRSEIAQVIASRIKNKERAIEICEDIIDRQPFHPRAFSVLIGLYEEDKNYQKAIEMLENWLEQNPNDDGANNIIKELRQKAAETDTTSR